MSYLEILHENARKNRQRLAMAVSHQCEVIAKKILQAAAKIDKNAADKEMMRFTTAAVEEVLNSARQLDSLAAQVTQAETVRRAIHEIDAAIAADAK